MAERTRGYAHSVEIKAPRPQVWRGLLEPELLCQWLGQPDGISARVGGAYRLRIDRDLTREAHIDVFEAERRLRLIYMPEPDMPASGSVIIDDFLLASGAQGCTLRLLGSGFPVDEQWDSFYLRLRNGWAQALARLKVLSEKLARESPATIQRAS